MSKETALGMLSDTLKPIDTVTIAREGLEFHVALHQPTLRKGTPARTSAFPIGLRIASSPEDFSWLNEKEVKLLLKLLNTGIANGLNSLRNKG